MDGAVETFVAGRNLHTPHDGEAYPGIRTVRPGPRWSATILCAKPGQTVAALGGEHCFAYETPDGARAEAFELRAGDRATLVRWDLPGWLGEWRVERGDETP